MVQWFLRNASFDFHMKITLDKGQKMTLTIFTHTPLLTQLVVCKYQLLGHWLQ